MSEDWVEGEKIEAYKSALEEIRDAVVRAHLFHLRRDQMNAASGRAALVLYEPLTGELARAKERILAILDKGKE